MTLRRTKAFDQGKLIHGLNLDAAGQLIITEDPASSTSPVRKSYLTSQLGNIVDAAPSALDTLNELAAALGDDANFATTVTTNLSNKVSTSTYTPADVLAKLLTVDGAGTGLDADTLDGYQAADFVIVGNLAGTWAATNHMHALSHSALLTVTNASTLTYNFTYTTSHVSVYINRLLMRPTEYTANNGTSITFSITLVVGDEIEVLTQGQA
jgi:hypothetical protein